ncbi:hypothetical protein [Tumebacillus lipolyticus]|uniref:Uncharacterized protein n=1 Tax=Tumebacillus lipolyticus TaxID=1280370 RepID=A0ABW4ZST4_9BACL
MKKLFLVASSLAMITFLTPNASASTGNEAIHSVVAPEILSSYGPAEFSMSGNIVVQKTMVVDYNGSVNVTITPSPGTNPAWSVAVTLYKEQPGGGYNEVAWGGTNASVSSAYFPGLEAGKYRVELMKSNFTMLRISGTVQMNWVGW